MSVYVSTSDEVAVARVAKNVTNEQGMLNDIFQALRTESALPYALRVGKAERTASTPHMIVRVNGQQMRRYHSPTKSAIVDGIVRDGDTYRVFFHTGAEVSLHDLAYTVRMVNPDKGGSAPTEIADED